MVPYLQSTSFLITMPRNCGRTANASSAGARDRALKARARGAVRSTCLGAPSRSSLDRLTHEYELKDQLDSAWAVRPLDLVRDAGRTMLVLEDVDGEPLRQIARPPMELGRFLSLAIAVAAAVASFTGAASSIRTSSRPISCLNPSTGKCG